MIKVITKDSPQKLIDKLNSYINSKSTSLWKIDEDGDYVLYTPDYQYKAWMTIEREYNKNTFNVCIIESKKNPMTKRIYSEYEKFLKTEYTDSFNMLRLFADTLNKDNLKNTCFYFVEFDDFTSIYLQIISKIYLVLISLIYHVTSLIYLYHNQNNMLNLLTFQNNFL